MRVASVWMSWILFTLLAACGGSSPQTSGDDETPAETGTPVPWQSVSSFTYQLTYEEIAANAAGTNRDDLARKMVALITRVSQYAKGRNPDFKVMPQNAPELVAPGVGFPR